MKLFVVLHHSANPSQKPQFDQINAQHRAQGYPRSRLGFWVGYHFFLGFDSTIKQARYEDEVGAHCNAKLMNYVGIGICLAGDFTKHLPSNAQIAALDGLVRGIQDRHHIPDEAILLHRECKPTACPGVDLRALLLEYRRAQAPVPQPVKPLTAAGKEMVARALARRIRRQR